MDKNQALQEKEKGNIAIQKNDFETALKHYTNAIKLDPSNHIFYSNRSMCYHKLGKYSKSLDDAQRIIELNPNWPKGYSRKAVALYSLQKYDECEECYKKALQLDPSNQDYRIDLDNLKNRILFEELKKDDSHDFNKIKRLISQKADPNWKNDCSTLYMGINNYASDEIIKLLIESGGEINLNSNNEKSSPFHRFCCNPIRKSSDHKMLSYFLDKKADPNLPNKYGITPFHYLCSVQRDTDCIQLMLDNKADLNTENFTGTPFLALLVAHFSFTNQTQVKKRTSFLFL